MTHKPGGDNLNDTHFIIDIRTTQTDLTESSYHKKHEIQVGTLTTCSRK